MRKGDARRQEIVLAAEKLFYMKGYENTSIQDVLLEAGISKGGFYHHFESKIKLLEEICVARIEEGCERVRQAIAQCQGDAVEKFNLLFDVGGFFEAGDLDFIRLMIRVIYQDGCVQLRDMMYKLRVETYEPILQRIVHEGVTDKLFFTRYPDNIARLILVMDNALNDELAGALGTGRGGAEDIMAFVDLLGVYRSGVERLLDAPYGSIRLVGLERVAEVVLSMEREERRHFQPRS